jgi:hypothetical protein
LRIPFHFDDAARLPDPQPIRSTDINADDQPEELIMTSAPLKGNGLPGREPPSHPLPTGRHARPASPPAGALSDLLRERSLDRIKAADRAIADAQARLRATGADPDTLNGAFALVRDSLNEARETVREARRELALILSEWEQLNNRLRGSSRYPESAAPVVADQPGANLCPDPGAARTPGEYMDTLRTYRTWAGGPSLRAMEHVIKSQCEKHYSASTLHSALKADTLPSLHKVQAIIIACGGTDAHRQMFTTAWRRLTMSRHDDAHPPRPHVLYPMSESA